MSKLVKTSAWFEYFQVDSFEITSKDEVQELCTLNKNNSSPISGKFLKEIKDEDLKRYQMIQQVGGTLKGQVKTFIKIQTEQAESAGDMSPMLEYSPSASPRK